MKEALLGPGGMGDRRSKRRLAVGKSTSSSRVKRNKRLRTTLRQELSKDRPSR
jgi:hypothetical protein